MKRILIYVKIYTKQTVGIFHQKQSSLKIKKKMELYTGVSIFSLKETGNYVLFQPGLVHPKYNFLDRIILYPSLSYINEEKRTLNIIFVFWFKFFINEEGERQGVRCVQSA
jgi:hypothetical protein